MEEREQQQQSAFLRSNPHSGQDFFSCLVWDARNLQERPKKKKKFKDTQHFIKCFSKSDRYKATFHRSTKTVFQWSTCHRSFLKLPKSACDILIPTCPGANICVPAEWVYLLTKAARNRPTGAAACFQTQYSP